MTTTPKSAAAALPPITVRQEDFETLTQLADGYAESMPEVAEYWPASSTAPGWSPPPHCPATSSPWIRRSASATTSPGRSGR